MRELAHHQATMSCLDRVRDDLALVKHVIRGVDVILASEKFGDHFARLISKRRRE